METAREAEDLDLEAMGQAVRRYRDRNRKILAEDAAALVDIYIERDGAVAVSQLVCDKEGVGLYPTVDAYARLMAALGESGDSDAVVKVFESAVLDAGPAYVPEPQLQALLVQGALTSHHITKVVEPVFTKSFVLLLTLSLIHI